MTICRRRPAVLRLTPSSSSSLMVAAALVAVAVLSNCSGCHAFGVAVVKNGGLAKPSRSTSKSTTLYASLPAKGERRRRQPASSPLPSVWAKTAAAGAAAALVFLSPLAANAVSGGGLDYANMDISGQDFSKNAYKGKDFTQGKWHCMRIYNDLSIKFFLSNILHFLSLILSSLMAPRRFGLLQQSSRRKRNSPAATFR